MKGVALIPAYLFGRGMYQTMVYSETARSPDRRASFEKDSPGMNFAQGD